STAATNDSAALTAARILDYSQTMLADQIAQVRRFNRLVTQRVGALDDHFLGRDRPLGASRLLYEIGRQGAELRDLRRRLGFEAGFDPAASLPAEDRDLVPPRGAFLLASLDGESIACGVVKAIGPGIGSLKRMWVADSVRGLGIGRRMLDALEIQARELGLTMLRLETNKELGEAIALYRSAGFREVAAFNDDPYAHHWFEKRLRRSS